MSKLSKTILKKAKIAPKGKGELLNDKEKLRKEKEKLRKEKRKSRKEKWESLKDKLKLRKGKGKSPKDKEESPTDKEESPTYDLEIATAFAPADISHPEAKLALEEYNKTHQKKPMDRVYALIIELTQIESHSLVKMTQLPEDVFNILGYLENDIVDICGRDKIMFCPRRIIQKNPQKLKIQETSFVVFLDDKKKTNKKAVQAYLQTLDIPFKA